MCSILAAFWPRSASIASTIAAGCATTTGPGCNSGATGCPSLAVPPTASAPTRPAHPPARTKDRRSYCPTSRAIFQLLAVDRGSEAKNAKSTFSNCSERTLWIKLISSPTASSWPSDSSSSSRRTSIAGKFRSRRIFRNFLAFERCRTHDRHAVKIVPRKSPASRRISMAGLRRRSHGV